MPTSASEHTFLYVDTDVPAGVTLSAWRGEKVRAARGRRSGILRRLGALSA
jgi:hypothetical protein